MRRITKATAASVLAIAGAVLAGPAVAAPTHSEPAGAAKLREVCAKTVTVKKRPGAVHAGSLHRGEKVKLSRYSASGRYAHIVAVRPEYTVRGWVDVGHLCRKGTSAEFAKTSRYSVRIVNSLAGGDPGFLYVLGPANITVRDAQKAGQTLTVCVTPAPFERASCRTGRTGQTIDSIVWSQSGANEVKITIDGGPTLVDTVYPYAIP